MEYNDSLDYIFRKLHRCPRLVKHLTLTGLCRFLASVGRLKDDILLPQPTRIPPQIAPAFLPPAIELFLSEVTGIPTSCMHECWTEFKDLAWSERFQCHFALSTIDAAFMQYGLKKGLAADTLYPPNRYCTTPGCPYKSLLKTDEHRSVLLFTLRRGVLPAYSTHLKCKACKTNYHHNFAVRGNRRYYYSGNIPEIIQVAEHHFVERQLITLWINMMLNAWVSASNCARIYNTTLANSTEDPGSSRFENWRFSPVLQTEHVWDGFTVLSLLEDCQRNGMSLEVPHGESQRDRFRSAMQLRNLRIQRCGLGTTAHYCALCTRFYDNVANGGGLAKVSCVVIDGVTIGHPCCSVRNCKTPLENQRHRFCPQHAEQNTVCAIKGCCRPTIEKSKACNDPTHQAMEQRHMETGQAQIRLRQSLARSRMAGAGDSFGLSDAGGPPIAQDAEQHVEEEFVVDANGNVVTAVTGTVTSSNSPTKRLRSQNADGLEQPRKRLRAQFSRLRTHNEQVLVAPCGVIIARSTFFGAEAIGTAVEFVKRTYFRGHLPNHLVYDSNCLLARYVRAQDDKFFDDIGLTIDVFHFKSKHKATDTFCQANCNPAAFPELYKEDGGWHFNTSIAEQTNVWIAGYNAICREMIAEKYNFFLDEMMLRRNEMTLAKLCIDGKNPQYWPANVHM